MCPPKTPQNNDALSPRRVTVLVLMGQLSPAARNIVPTPARIVEGGLKMISNDITIPPTTNINGHSIYLDMESSTELLKLIYGDEETPLINPTHPVVNHGTFAFFQWWSCSRSHIESCNSTHSENNVCDSTVKGYTHTHLPLSFSNKNVTQASLNFNFIK